MRVEERCNSCAYLYEDEQGKWICDLYQKEIHRVADEDCPVADDSTEWGNEEE